MVNFSCFFLRVRKQSPSYQSLDATLSLKSVATKGPGHDALIGPGTAGSLTLERGAWALSIAAPSPDDVEPRPQ